MILISSAVAFLVGALLMGVALFTGIDSKTTISTIGMVLMILALCFIVVGTMVRVNEKDSKKKG